MSQTQMRRAQEFIKNKQYAKARAILTKIDDPRAREWLARIDKIDPPKSARPRTGPSIIGRIVGFLLTIIASALLTVGVIAALVIFTSPSRGGEGFSFGAVAEESTPTITPIPRMGVVQSNQRVNLRAEANTTSAILFTLDPGTAVVIIREEGDWYRVRMDNGAEGWISAGLLDADPAATAVADAGATAATPDDEDAATATPDPDAECTTGEAQAWYNEQRQSINSTRFLLFQVEEGRSVDARSALNTVRANRVSFEAVEALPCVAEARGEYIVAFQASDNSFQNTINNFSNEANAERAIATQRFMAADDLLTEKFEFEPNRNACGVEWWYAGTVDQIIRFIELTDGVTAATPPSDTIRTGIFDLQDIRRNVDVATPDCVDTAYGHLTEAIDSAIALFQNVMSQDVAGSSSRANAMVAQRSAFLNEMQRLGVPVVINRNTENGA